jgi:hypothetical protein
LRPTLPPRRTLHGPQGDTLENLIVDALPNGSTCVVLDQGELYRLDKGSMALVSSPFVIATSRGASVPGRWLRATMPSSSKFTIGDAALVLMDNRYNPGPDWDGASVYGYSDEIVAQPFYDGPPDVQIDLPEPISGIGHGFAVLPDGSLLMATSEDSSDVLPPPNHNYNERFWYIPAGMTGAVTVPPVAAIPCGSIFQQYAPEMWGARSVALFSDGTTMLSRAGGLFARPSIPMMRGVGNITTTPAWRNTGSRGEIIGWDCQVETDGDRHLVWHQGWDSFYRNDLDVPPGDTGPDKIAKGSNIGAAQWGGGFTFDKDGNCHLVRSHLRDIAFFDKAQIDALGTVHSNPVPARTLKTALWDQIDLNYESIWGIALDVHGGLYVSTNSFANPWPRTRVFYIEPDAVAQGGTQSIARTLVAPQPTILGIRLGLGRGAFLR